ncbi:tyrosine-protein kinase Etk/Wzc [Oxalobacteraceae bacterium GrIS 1.11]
MSEIPVTVLAAVSSQQTHAQIDAIDIVTILARRKKLVLGLPFAAAVCAALLSFLMPNVYKANTRILPPQQAQSGAAALMAQLGGVAGAAAGAAGVKNPNDLYMGMLKSRTIADKLVVRFDLKKVYGRELLEPTRKDLDNNTTFTSGKDGLINIEVEDEDRKRAVDLADAYADELLKLTKVLAVTEAAQRRLFFENQLQLTKDNLARAEATLKEALDAHGVISVDSQSRAIVETVARLRAQIAAKDIQLNAMRAFVTNNNQDYKRVEQELLSMRAELSRQENGNPESSGQKSDAGDQEGLKNIKVLRDVKYYQMLYEMLSKQYEIARLDESKDASIIQVLDKAQLPERKFKPRRTVITVMSALLVLAFTVLWVLAAGLLELSKRNPENAEKLEALRQALRSKRA